MKPLRIAVLAAVFSALASALGGAAFAADLASGDWDVQKKRISGTWSIIEKDDGRYVVLSDDFKTRKAPDLKIFLSPREAKDVTKRNATAGTFVGELQSAKGGQSLKIPEAVNLEDFSSLVLHCEQYTVLWGAGDLR